ncbi:MAG: pyruvate kinase [Verrucomicrobia bacterium]|nr:pyruvate kinase [Verrucomicrobiota bacterium]
MRRTRLLATLGPASDSNEILTELIEAGTDTFRINMSHAPHDWARDLAARIRHLAEGRDRPVGILFDLQGPSIRTGTLEKPFDLKTDDRVEFRLESADPAIPLSTTVNYDGLVNDVEVGATLLVDNGAIIMDVESVQKDRIVCLVKTVGEFGSRRHINLPGVRLNLPALTEKDGVDIKLAVECNADFIAGSFVRDAGHVRELRKAIQDAGGHALIVSKIEDQEAVRNLDDIIVASDLIMVARGDLGIEVHIEELPILQRRIVKRCLTLGRRVIVATHLLESMISNPTPTRAEVTDVSNAVYEEADSLMVSGETSVGKYPVRCIEILDRVSRRIERSGGRGYASEAKLVTEKQKTVRAACNLADSIPEALIVVFTRSGNTAVQAALLRPRAPIYAFTPDEVVYRSLSLARGVRPFQLDFAERPKRTIAQAVDILRCRRDIPTGTPLVIVSDTLQQEHAVDTILVEHA